jgi:hypothetical protein
MNKTLSIGISLILAFQQIIIIQGQSAVGNSSRSIKQIDLVKAVSTNKKYSLSDIATSIEYIPLQTTSYSLLRPDLQVFILKNEIIVYDYDKCCRFDRKGKYLNTIGKTGKGPGEYIRAISCEIDEIKRSVFLLDMFGKKIIEYDFSGKYIKSIPINFTSQAFHILSKDLFIYHNMYFTNSRSKENKELSIIDQKGKLVKSFSAHLNKDVKYGVILTLPIFYVNQNLTYFKSPVNDTVFQISSSKKSPAYVLNTGKYGKNKDFDDLKNINKPVYDVIIVADIEENSNYLFVYFGFGMTPKTAMFNKSTNAIFCIGKDHEPGFENDIDGGISFWPKGKISEKVFYSYFQAVDMIEKFENKSLKAVNCKDKGANARLVTIQKNLSPEDNPILQIVTFK